MGDDFSSFKVFAGPRPEVLRASLVKELPRYMAMLGFRSARSKEAADRSIVVGPASRWIHVGDTAGSTETADPDAFDNLSLELSALAPVISLKASDSAAIHIELRENGHIVDKFGNMRFPFYYFADTEEASPYFGRPERWRHLLLDRDELPKLREIWSRASIHRLGDGNFFEILGSTADLFGMDRDLLELGYTQDMDGVGLPYDEYLSERGVSLDGFEEFHFEMDETSPFDRGTVEADIPGTLAEYSLSTLCAALDVLKGDGTERFLGLFNPSFHPETLLVVELEAEDAHVLVSSTEESIYMAVHNHEQAAKAHASGSDDEEPIGSAKAQVWYESGQISPPAAREVRESLDQLFQVAEPRELNDQVRDGMTALGRHVTATGKPRSFADSNPEPGDSTHAYFVYLLQVIGEALGSARVNQRIKDLFRYLEVQ